MLQDIRNSSQSMAAKIIVGLIIVTFALFGAESIVGGLSGEPEVATVNGEEISESRFMRALEGHRRQLIAQMGDRADPDLIDEGLLRSTVLEGMIEEEIYAQDAQSKGLYIADVSVDSFIRNMEQFKVDGAFSSERMQMLLRNAGLTMEDFRDSLRRQFVMDHSRSGIVSSAFLLPNESNELISLDRQERSFGVATVAKSNYLDSVSVSDVEVSDYYEKNKSSYTKAQNVDVSYIELKKTALAESVEVTDSALLDLYEQEKAEFVGEEERQAAHILIKIDDNRSDEQALAEIESIAARIKSGEAFDEVAKASSEDEGSASNGGDLGLSGKGVYVSDFESALYALTINEISDPVKTEFGYHLIKLLAVEENSIPPFDEMKAALEVRYKEQKTEEIYAELSEQLADLTYASPDLAEPADELELAVKELAGVSASTSDRIFSNVKVQRVLFSDDLVKDSNNSELIEIDDGHAVVFRVNEYHEESIQALELVRDQIHATLLSKEAEAFAESVGQAFILRVNAGEDARVVSEDMGLDWKEHENVKRDDVSVKREILMRAFAIKLLEAPEKSIEGFSVTDGDFNVVLIDGVKQGSAESATAYEKQTISNMAGRSLGVADFQIYQDIVVRDAQIERL